MLIFSIVIVSLVIFLYPLIKNTKLTNENFDNLRLMLSWLTDRGASEESIRYKIYHDPDLCEIPGAVIFVGQFNSEERDSQGFYLEILNNRIVLEKLFFPSGITSWHSFLSQQCKQSGTTLYSALVFAEKSHNENRFNLITDLEIQEFGEDLIDLARRVAFESKIIDQSYLFGELTSSHISEKDIDKFGGDLVFLARRVMEDVKRKAAISEPDGKNFIKPNSDDDEYYGADLLDIFYKVAQEEFKVRVDNTRHKIVLKYYSNNCDFCGGRILRSTNVCEKCGTRFK